MVAFFEFLAGIDDATFFCEMDDIFEKMSASSPGIREIKDASNYTYWLVNNDLNEASLELESIVRAERIKLRDRSAIKNFIFNPKGWV